MKLSKLFGNFAKAVKGHTIKHSLAKFPKYFLSL